MLRRSAANVYHATWITGKNKPLAKKEKRKIKYSTTKIESEFERGKLASAVDSNTSDCTGEEKGSVRRFSNFIGERVMGGVLEPQTLDHCPTLPTAATLDDIIETD
ncbi:hypothetical protein ACFE04_020847 [Oxalis oulophora]